MRQPVLLRLALLNDQPVVLAGLSAILAACGTPFEIRQVTTTLADLDHDLDVVLFDSFGAPGMTARIKELLDHTRAAVLIVSAHPLPSTLITPRVHHLGKNASTPELVAGRPRHWPGQAHGLTQRESEIVALVATGVTNADVATTLFLSIDTIKSHIRTAYRKAGVSTRATAILWALSHGFEAQPD